MEKFLEVVFFSATLVYILVETNALEEYLKLFLKVIRSKHDLFVSEFPGFSLLERLRLKYPDNFFTALAVCPTCITVWIAGLSSLIFVRFDIFMAGAAVYCAWVLYMFMVLLVKKNNS